MTPAEISPDEIRAARRQLGLTQVELARALGVAQSTVSMWETGERPAPKMLSLALDRLLASH